jgi:hypothetical protein
MKRDMDLIRSLLLRLEGLGSSDAILFFDASEPDIAVDGYSTEQIDYHLSLIWEAGFVETGIRGSGNTMSGDYAFQRLSWRGHDLVDSVRDPKVWRKTKSYAERAGGWTVGMLGTLAKEVIKQELQKFGMPLP